MYTQTTKQRRRFFMTRKTQEIIPTSEFINLYKEYETVLRDTMNSNPYAYESTATTSK